MIINKFTDMIGELIAKDDLPQAIDLLHKLLQKSPKLDEVILQSARFSDITRQIRMGTVNFEEANVTKNKIRYAILDLLRDIEENVELNDALKREIEELPEENTKPTISQVHHGSGDNIIGNKIINNAK
jgi:Effector-associated domain 11